MNTPNREEVVNRRLAGVMAALQACYDLIEAHYLAEDFATFGEAQELTARVMADIRILAARQMEAM